MAVTIGRPGPDEHDPMFARYIGRVQGDIHESLARQLEETAAFFAGLSETQAGYRYAPGKWRLADVLGHMADTERILSCRALCIARGETQALPGFDEDAYAAHANSRSLAALMAEFRAVREATRHLVASFDEAAIARRGVANNRPITVRALAYVITGHELHHLAVIRERYVPGLSAGV